MPVLENIQGFGAIRAKAFYDGIRSNKKRIDDILAAGVKIKAKTKGKLSNKNFCFTGASSLSRPQLHKLVEDNGGDVKKSVGKGLMFLVQADANSSSSKSESAKKFGTKIISEQEFMDMLK